MNNDLRRHRINFSLQSMCYTGHASVVYRLCLLDENSSLVLSYNAIFQVHIILQHKTIHLWIPFSRTPNKQRTNSSQNVFLPPHSTSYLLCFVAWPEYLLLNHAIDANTANALTLSFAWYRWNLLRGLWMLSTSYRCYEFLATSLIHHQFS